MLTLTKNLCLGLMIFILFVLSLNGINVDRNLKNQILAITTQINQANITQKTEIQNLNQDISTTVSELKEKKTIVTADDQIQNLTDFDKKIVEDTKKQRNKEPSAVR